MAFRALFDKLFSNAEHPKLGSRRQMIKMVGAATAGAVGATMADAMPASANGNGTALLLGEENTCSGTTAAGTSVGIGLWGADTSVPDPPTGTGIGVQGSSAENVGVYGTSGPVSGILPNPPSGSASGVIGDSENGFGVFGLSKNFNGVEGQSGSGYGGSFSTGSGIAAVQALFGQYAVNAWGQSVGVYGRSDDDSGLLSSEPVAGVIGDSNSGPGVLGLAGNGNSGVYGESNGPSEIPGTYTAGVVGDSNDSTGVIGLSSTVNGVGGYTLADNNSGVAGFDTSAGGGYGLYGSSNINTGLWAIGGSNGYGVQAQGGKSQLHLVPAATAGHPTSGEHLHGELFADSSGDLWFCKASGTPGTWKKIA
ncbi:MAG TPA: hypothetical protein VEJ87_16990 [Acidimicrobiales bacterium]|nr:hypothetical protein [Acidimicrobiales bacterium]